MRLLIIFSTLGLPIFSKLPSSKDQNILRDENFIKTFEYFTIRKGIYGRGI